MTRLPETFIHVTRVKDNLGMFINTQHIVAVVATKKPEECTVLLTGQDPVVVTATIGDFVSAGT